MICLTCITNRAMLAQLDWDLYYLNLTRKRTILHEHSYWHFGRLNTHLRGWTLFNSRRAHALCEGRSTMWTTFFWQHGFIPRKQEELEFKISYVKSKNIFENIPNSRGCTEEMHLPTFKLNNKLWLSCYEEPINNNITSTNKCDDIFFPSTYFYFVIS